MSKYVEASLRGKISIKHGFSFKGEYFDSEGDYILLTPGNFKEEGGFKLDLAKAKFYKGDFPIEYICKKGDLVVAMTEQAEGLLGSMAIVPEDNRFLHNQRIGLVTVDENEIDVKYLYHLFNTKSVRSQVRLSSSGSKVKHTSPDRMYDVIVRLPGLSTQQKMSSVLSSLDAKIELNNRINAELEAMAKTLYDYWFVQFDFPNAEGKPYKSSGGAMVWSEELKREIPEGWEVKKLRDIEANIVTGKTPPTDNKDNFNGSIPFITIGDIRGNIHILNTTNYLSTQGAECQKNKFLPKGSLCVSCIATIGLVGFTTEQSQTNQQINSIIFDKTENRYYLYFALIDYFQFSNGAKTGNTFANMNKDDFSSILLYYPEWDVLTKFDKEVDNIFNQILNNQYQNQQLAHLRDWLLPMLMNGQVVVE